MDVLAGAILVRSAGSVVALPVCHQNRDRSVSGDAAGLLATAPFSAELIPISHPPNDRLLSSGT